MISLELARKLKEAGLEWEPQMYDFFTMIILEKPIIACVTDKWTLDSVRKEVLEFKGERRLFLPRLDQLLAEIEKWGYSWEMRTVIDESQSVRFNAKNIAYWIHVWKTGHIEWEDGFKRTFTSPSNAAAEALLWIYEGRAKA